MTNCVIRKKWNLCLVRIFRLLQPTQTMK
jgi:hypothetical protein